MAKTMASLQAFPSSLLPRAWSRALIPFPFPFQRLPRRLKALQSDRHNKERDERWGLACLCRVSRSHTQDFQAPAAQARLSIQFQFLLTCTFILKMLYTTYNLGAYLMLCEVSQKCYVQRNYTQAPVVQRLDYAIH